MIVFTDWMGRSPQEIEDQVTYPLSVNLQGLAGVKVVRSSSEFNFSMINVIFDDATDYYFARQRVLERLSIASTFLPPGVTPYLAPDATALGQIFWYTVEGDGQRPGRAPVDPGLVRPLPAQQRPGRGRGGVGRRGASRVSGRPRPEQAPGLRDRPGRGLLGGRAVELGRRRPGDPQGERRVPDPLGRLDPGPPRPGEHRRRPARTGRRSTCGTSARCRWGPAFRRSVLEKDGKEVVGGVVMMRYGENPLEVTRRVKEKITSLQAGLPEGVRIVPFYDRTPLIRNALAHGQRHGEGRAAHLHGGDPADHGAPGRGVRRLADACRWRSCSAS